MLKVRFLTKLYLPWRDTSVWLTITPPHLQGAWRIEDTQQMGDWNLDKKVVHIHQELLSQHHWHSGPFFCNSELKLNISNCRKCSSMQMSTFLAFLLKLRNSDFMNFLGVHDPFSISVLAVLYIVLGLCRHIASRPCGGKYSVFESTVYNYTTS